MERAYLQQCKPEWPLVDREEYWIDIQPHKGLVLTNSSAGVAVILNDLQLTQEYIDLTSSYD